MPCSRDQPRTALAFPRSAPATGDVVQDQRAVLLAMLDDGRFDLPLPGCGRTGERWKALAAWGGHDLVLARLAEGHTDAVAVLVEAGVTSTPMGMQRHELRMECVTVGRWMQ